MDLRRLRAGEWLMAAAAVALLAVLVVHGEVDVAPVLLAILALAAIGTVVLVAGAGTAAPGIASESLVLLGSLIGAVVALVAGMWGALVAVLAVTVTSLVAMRDERLSSPGRLTDSTGVPVSAAPQPEHVDLPRV